MAQYTELSTAGTDTLTLFDGTTRFRLQVRGDVLYFDQELILGGFSGVKGVGWDNIDESYLPGVNQESFRVGARSLNWNVDQEITPTGFGGIKGIDWDNIEQHSLGLTTTSTTSTTT